MAGVDRLFSLQEDREEQQCIEVKELGRYKQLGVLGAGTYGLVIKAADTSDPAECGSVAIKLLPRGGFVREYRRYVLREILHHGNLKHPFIVELKEVFTTPEYLAIVMEYAQGGNLHRFLTDRCENHRLTEQQGRWLFQQLIIGVDFCHKMGVANRDLKLENLLLDQDSRSGNPLLKICDFGYSKHDLSSTTNTRLGTPIYMAPEIIFVSKKYDAKKADMWSCGIILYAMLYGYYPFNPRDPKLPKQMLEGKVLYPAEVPISEACQRLIAGMLKPVPEERLSVEQVMADPWFQTDLPEGALTMNQWYMDNVDSLEDRVDTVQAIVEAAAGPSKPGEPNLYCLF